MNIYYLKELNININIQYLIFNLKKAIIINNLNLQLQLSFILFIILAPYNNIYILF